MTEIEDYNWDDVTPVAMEEEPEWALCRIMYSEEYKQKLALLRALLRTDEHSERALALTDWIIEQVPAHYTVWNYRYNIVRDIERDLKAELAWCTEVSLDKPKNYQIWHYRGLIVELYEKKHGKIDFKLEYAIMNEMIDWDSKNYHVWAYHKWFVERYGLFRDRTEVAYTAKLIDEDVRNNSAWSHRFFVMLGDKKLFGKDISGEWLGIELRLVKAWIAKCPENPSAWTYLAGVHKLVGYDITQDEAFAEQYTTVPAIEYLARIYETKKEVAKAAEVYRSLASEHDPIRRKYWEMKSEKVLV